MLLWFGLITLGLLIYVGIGLAVVAFINHTWPEDGNGNDSTSERYLVGAVVLLWPLVIAIGGPVGFVYLVGTVGNHLGRPRPVTAHEDSE